MGRSIAPWLLLAIVVGACATGDSEPAGDATTSSTTTSAEASTTTLLAADMTEDCGLVDLDEASATIMDGDCSYSTPVFGISMTITPYDDTWISFGQGNRWMVLEQDVDRDGATDAALTLLLVNSDQDPAAVLEQIVQQDRVQTVAPASAATVLGRSAISVDVRVEPDVTFPCGTRIARFLNTGSYVALLNEGPNRTFGLPGCRTSRVWVLTVDDLTLTVIGAVRDADDFEPLMADLERFLNDSMQIGEQACPDPVAIEGRGRIWKPGCVYTASSFLTPLVFRPNAPGWTSIGAADEWVAIKLDADGDGGADASITWWSYEIDSDPSLILDTIVAFDGVEPISERSSLVLAELQTIALSVDAERLEAPNPGDDGCSQPIGTAFFFQDFPGYVLRTLPLRPGPDAFGIPACYRSRIWVSDVDGTSITAIGVASDPDDFDELVPILEAFLENNVTFGEIDE